MYEHLLAYVTLSLGCLHLERGAPEYAYTETRLGVAPRGLIGTRAAVCQTMYERLSAHLTLTGRVPRVYTAVFKPCMNTC